MKTLFLLCCFLWASGVCSQSREGAVSDSVAPISTLSVPISRYDRLLLYNLQMLDQLAPLLQKKGAATDSLLIHVQAHAAWLEAQLLAADVALTGTAHQLEAVKSQLKAAQKRQRRQRVKVGVGGVLLGVVVGVLIGG